MLSREQSRAEANTLFEHVLEHINTTLIPRHHAGELDAADVVFVASIALCEAAASVLFQNRLANNDAAVQRITKGFCEMFERKAEQVVKYERFTTQDHPVAQDNNTSGWD